METVLTYAMDQAYTSSRRTLLSEFRGNEDVRRLIERGVLDARRACAPVALTLDRRSAHQTMSQRPHTHFPEGTWNLNRNIVDTRRFSADFVCVAALVPDRLAWLTHPHRFIRRSPSCSNC